MNDSNRWATRALQHIRALSKSIGPRPATSAAERRAAEYVRDEMLRMGVRDVRLEPFEGTVSTWLPWATAFSLAAWGMLSALLLGLVGGIVAALLYAVSTWIVYKELYPGARMHPVRRRLLRGKSQNVVGVLPPADTPTHQVVLLAYLDTARTPFFWRTTQRRKLAGCLAMPLFLSLPLSAVVVFLGGLTGQLVFYIVAFVLMLPQIAALIVSLWAGRSPANPGANNNASGVGTLLALSERLRESPLTRTEVQLLATGCRETGGDGIRAFLAAHGESLRQAIFVAIEGVGVGERLVYLDGEGLAQRTAYDSEAVALAGQAAQRCGAIAARHPGGPTETGLLTRDGFKGTTISMWPGDRPGVAARRRADDVVDAIDPNALAQAHTFAWTLLQVIDGRLESNP